jgi:hypothetical protein
MVINEVQEDSNKRIEKLKEQETSICRNHVQTTIEDFVMRCHKVLGTLG